MATTLNKEDAERAIIALTVKLIATPKEEHTKAEGEFLQTIPTGSRAKVLTKARSNYHASIEKAAESPAKDSNQATTKNQVKEMATETTTAPAVETAAPAVAETAAPAEGTAPAAVEGGAPAADTDTKTRKRGENVKLTPETKISHKVSFGIKQLQGLAKLDNFSGFDLEKLKAETPEYKDKTVEEIASIISQQFDKFSRKFVVGAAEDASKKPLANDEHPKHELALGVIRAAFTAASGDKANQKDGKPDAGKVNRALAKQANKIFNDIKAVYEGEPAAKRGGKPLVASFETVSWGLF